MKLSNSHRWQRLKKVLSIFFITYFLISPFFALTSISPAYAAEDPIGPSLLEDFKITPQEASTVEELKIVDIDITQGETFETDTITINIETNTPKEISYLRYKENESELQEAEWIEYEEDYSLENLEVRDYLMYFQIQDVDGNISKEDYLLEFSRIAQGPIGSITIDSSEIEAKDDILSIDFSKITDESQITGYKTSLDQLDLQSQEYITPFVQNTEIEIPDETATYTVLTQFVDEWGNESEVISSSIDYKKYDILPQVSAEAIDPLFGGEMYYEITLQNTGTDDGFNGLLEVTLPKGFEYIESATTQEIRESGMDNTNPAYKDPIEPTYINTNTDKRQVLKYQSIADLLTGESITVGMKLKVAGQDSGYKIGETVAIDITGSLSKRNDWTIGFSNSISHEFELLPFVADINEHKEVLIGEELDNEITIKSNPDQDSLKAGDQQTDESESNPVVVRFELDNGFEYEEGSQSVENYIGLGDYFFNVIDTLDGTGKKVLEWIFSDGFAKDNYNNEIRILFKTILTKEKSKDPLMGDEYVLHQEKLKNKLSVDADYKTGEEIDDQGNILDIIKNFSNQQNQEIKAKYFTISKNGTPNIKDVRGEINYTLNIKVSKNYKLTGITITDILSDGLEFKPGSESEALYSTYFDPATGKTTLVWRLLEIQPGGEYQITYTATLEENYESKEGIDKRLLSNDYLKNSVAIDAIWDDIEADGRSSEGQDSDAHIIRTNRPVITAETKLLKSAEWGDETDVRVGDIVDVRTNIEFPSDVPTDEFKYNIYFPVGTKVVDGSINVTSTLTSDNSSTDYVEITGGIEFNFGKVEPGGSWTLTYQLEVQDDPNLKLATVTRNLFRADYLNIEADKFTHRDEITLNLIEPQLQVSKRKIDGYLASGEEAVIEVSITNTGTSGAYDLDISEYIPANSTLVQTGEIFSVCPVNFNDTEQRYEVVDCDLAAGEEIRYYYKIEGNVGLLTGDDMGSTIEIDEYYNRAEEEEQIKRTFGATTYNYNWKAVEPALITDLSRVESGLVDENVIKLGRDDEFELIASVENVGGAPAYDGEIVVDMSQIQDLVELNDVNLIAFEVYKNGVLISGVDFNIVDGVYTFSNLNLLPGDEVEVHFSLQTERFAEFGLEYPVSVEAEALNALEELVRKDTSNELSADTDNDDQTSKLLTISKLDNQAPYGFIYFKDPDTGEYIAFTNKDFANLDYRAYDPINPDYAKNEVVAVRFSDDGENWFIVEDLLDCDVWGCGELDGTWQVWDGQSLMRGNNPLESEGKNYRYMEVADLYGNIAEIENYVVKDTQAPVEGAVMISPDANDFYDRRYTGLLENYLIFWAQDKDTDLDGNPLEATDYAGVGKYRYIVADQELDLASGDFEGEWLSMNEGINKILADWSEFDLEEGDLLHVYIQYADLAGNISETIYHDDIIFTTEAPVININLNGGDEFTNYSLVNLGLEIEESVSGSYEIRFGADGTTFEDWIIYTEEISEYILPEGWVTGDKQLCAQIRDHAGLVSNVACDTIILDTLAPEGNVLINNDDVYTESTTVTLSLEANDPVLDDGLAGAGGIEFQYSLNGADWSEYEPLVTEKEVTLTNPIGTNTVYVKYRDALGNESSRYSDDILVNPFYGTGNIIINENELFTNTDLVTLDLTASGEPVLMRFFEHTSEDASSTFTPPTPPDISTPAEDPENVNNCGNGDEWTYWYEYIDYRQCYMQDEFGLKDVYVQYLYENGETSPIYNDGIIYAPYYGVEYLKDSFWNLNDEGNKEYGLGQIPGEVLSQDNFTIRFSAKNTGSLVWQKYSDNPVHVTYRWIPIENDYDWTDDMPNGGNRAVMNGDVSWNEETGELEMLVDTPVFPGEYKLVVDTIHEGVTWFSEYNNPTLEYEVQIDQNPDKETPDPDVLGEVDLPPNAGGWRDGQYDQNCDSKYGNWNMQDQCYITGTVYPADSPYNALIISTGGKVYNFNSSKLPDYYGKEVKINVHFYKISPTRGYFVIDGGPWEIAKTWIAQKFSQNYSGIIHAHRGDQLWLEIDYKNAGTATWNKSNTFLYTNNSTFTHINVDKNNIPIIDWYPYDISPGAAAKFGFDIKVPDGLANNLYTICYAPKSTAATMSYNEETCFKIQVENTTAEEREYQCSLPQKVYDAINGNVIGEVASGDHIIMFQTEGDWTRVYYKGNYDAWVKNDWACYSDSTEIDNPIDTTKLPKTDPPAGDEGIIIAVDGIDMRLGPSVNFPVIDVLPYGEKVRVLQETTQKDGYPGWLYIERQNGSRGWIPKGYTAHINDPADVTIDLKPPYYSGYACDGAKDVFTGPGFQYAKKGTLVTNKDFTIIHKWKSGENTWYFVLYSYYGETGWINGESNVCQGSYTPPKNYSGNVGGVNIYKDLIYSSPVDNRGVTSSFGQREGGFHHATDYVSKQGSCGVSIKASASGKVSKAIGSHPKNCYEPPPVKTGNSIIDATKLVAWNFRKYTCQNLKTNFVYIDHDNGTRTAYVHLDKVYVKAGDSVNREQVIGTMGNSGWSTGCHLHFEIWTDKNQSSSRIDPEAVLSQKVSVADLSIQIFKEKYLENISGEHDTIDWCGYRTKEINSCEVVDGTSAQWGSKLIYNPNIGRTIMVRNGILDKYEALGGPCSVIGAPIYTSGRPTSSSKWVNNYYAEVVAADNPHTGTGGWVQRFSNGSIYFNDKFWSSFAVIGEMEKDYEAQGGSSGWLGFPTSDRYQEKGGWCQNFERDRRCIGQTFTEYEKKISDLENTYSNVVKDGGIVKWCGAYVQKYSSITTDYGNKGGSVIIVNPEDNQAYFMTGSILWKYKQLNGESCSYPEVTGYPKSNELKASKSKYDTSGWVQHFAHKNKGWSSIYNSSLGTYLVSGEIRSKYESMGGTSNWNYLGFPTNDEKSGCQDFEGGNICGNSVTQYEKITIEELDTNEYTVAVMKIPIYQDNICIKSHVGLKSDYYNYSGNNRFDAKDFEELSTEDRAKYKGMKPIAGINTDFYAKDPERPLGVNIEEGEKYYSTDYNKNYWSMIIDGSENISFKTNQQIYDMSEFADYNAAAGYLYYVKDGEVRENAKEELDDDGTISVAGIVESNNKKYIITITKAGKDYVGGGGNKVTLNDTIEIFKKYGILKHAIEFDGGASPAFYYNQDGSTKVKDTYYDIIAGLYFYSGQQCKN